MDKFLLGLGVGMIGGMLFAPKSGSEMRSMIADKAGDGADYLKSAAQQGVDQVKSMTSDGIDYVKSKSGDVSSMASRVADEGKKAIRREGDMIEETVQHI